MEIHRFEAVRNAVRFLTIFAPDGSTAGITKDSARAAMRFFPVAGLVAGAVSAAVVIFLSPFVESRLLLAVFAIATLALVTRGLHLDGTGDCFDALNYFGDRDKALAVMKDKTLGSFGTAAIVFVVTAKIFALGSVFPGAFTDAVVAVPAVSRFGSVIVSHFSGDDGSAAKGLGSMFNFDGDGGVLAGAAIPAFLIPLLLCGLPGILIAIAVSAAAFVFCIFFKRAFGTPNGDVHGAVIEMCEVVGFMVAGAVL